MLNVPVYNMAGQKVGDAEIDEAALGGSVNPTLLKQAVVMYHANQRQGTAKTKGRSEVQGSGRKIFRQKGTGRARMGNARTCIRRGGGMAFAKRPREFRQQMPKKMRRLARNQAVLAKIQSEDVLIVEDLKFETPKTAPFAKLLAAVDATRGCVVATDGVDLNVYKSGRNIPRTEILDVAGLNAFQVLTRRKLVFTREAFDRFKELAAGPAQQQTVSD
ncbi:MAG: 50S ribosomal protein L4 [Phycisphaerae bacterium]|nr:50S ribosomal protein L4 [Phycisphaerae bacterium]